MDLGRADRKALAQEDCNRSAFKPVAIVSVRRPRQCGWNVQAARSVRLNRGQQEIFQRSKRRKMCLHAAILPANSKDLALVERSAGYASTSSAPQEEVLIEIRDVFKSFGSKEILKGASIKIRRGEAVGIIGGSGTGKSTTLRLMAGLLSPDQGDVIILGKKREGLLMDDPELADRLKIGLVFQNGALFDSLTVGENVGFQLIEHSHLPASRIKELVAESLTSVGLSGVEKLYPSELSGGMRKRVALARAIIRDDSHSNAEQIIMYDEPTAGLDPVASTVVEDLIRSLHDKGPSHNGNGMPRKGGVASYIVVTHQHSTIRRSVDRLIFLHGTVSSRYSNLSNVPSLKLVGITGLHEGDMGFLKLEGQVVWEGTVEEFDSTEEPIVRQFASGSLEGPIKYE